MLWDDFKKNYNNYKEQPIENLGIDVLKNMYKDLVYIATETAFDEVNRDTEFLLRILLLQHRINFNEESKQYENPNWDKSCEINGIKFEREKTYLINEDRVDEYTKQLEYQLKEKEEKIRFIKGNPSSYAAMYLLNGMRNDFTLKDYAATFAAFDQALREMPLGKEMQGAIDIALRTEVGAIAPDFEKVDKDGNTIRLSDYRGKYVLLDFWGSWCSPCRDSHPHLKEIEAKYRDKGLVVINIATENGSKAREIWLQAIEEDGMTWTQILNNEGKDKCDVVKDYAITAFPTKVLIDGDGKIVVRAVGESEPIDAKLKEVFGE